MTGRLDNVTHSIRLGQITPVRNNLGSMLTEQLDRRWAHVVVCLRYQYALTR
jgi:hypothetical protein